MNTTILSTAFGAVLLLATSALAQDTLSTSAHIKPFSPATSFNTWSIGIHAGVLAPVTFLGKNDYTKWGTDVGYGAYLKKQISPVLAVKANFLAGKLKGDNNETLGNGSAVSRPYSSFETQIKWAGSLEGSLTLANINWLNRKSLIQPFVSAGAGLMGYSTSLVTAGGNTVEYTPGKNIQELFIPVGAGVNFNVSPRVGLEIGYKVNLVDADNVDGYHYGPQNDKFSYGHIGLDIALGASGKPRLSNSNPVANMEYDYLAQDKQVRDELAAEKARSAAQLNEFRTEWNKVLADADKDGVSDYFDKCPGTAADVKVDGAGCPLPQAKNVTTIITEEDRRVVREAINNLEFDFGKATIRPKSFPTLDKVAELLTQKNFSLKLAGHTDNVGSSEANLRLSKARAEAIKQYLVSKGANASRVEATGYGESQPITSNKTEAGRQQNRRVEFSLF